MPEPATFRRVCAADLETLLPLLRAYWAYDGIAYRDAEVRVTSKMREGRVYLDGPHELLELPMGARLTLHLRAPPLHLYATQEMALRRETARKNAVRSVTGAR